MSRLSIEILGSWKNTEKWLSRMTSRNFTRVLHKVGNQGEKALKQATPIGKTGQTSNGWRYNVNNDELYFNNIAHPEESVNIAKIKDLGHGTGTGGYVPGKHYIKPAMSPVWDYLSKLINEELKG